MNELDIIKETLNQLVNWKNAIEANSKSIDLLPPSTNGNKLVAVHNQTSLDTEKFDLSAALIGFNQLNDKITALGTITRVDNTFTFSIGYQWILNGINYANTVEFEFEINLADTGKLRTDIVYLDTTNSLILIQGFESTDVAQQPETPPNTLLLCVFNVTDSSVNNPITNTNKLVKKINGNSPYTLIQSDTDKYLLIETEYDLIIPIGLNDNSEFVIKNISATNRELTFDSGIEFKGNPIIPNNGLCLLKKIDFDGTNEIYSINTINGNRFDNPLYFNTIIPATTIIEQNVETEGVYGLGFYNEKLRYITPSGFEGAVASEEWVNTNINTNVIEVKLSENINKGQAVYISDANGTNIIVSKASNATEATSSKTLGLLETTGTTNDIVKVVTKGFLRGLNTNSATIGDAVWLGTNGNLIFGLSNKPVAPAHLVYLGVVSRVHSTNGEILVSVQNGFEMNEIHDFSDVSYSSPIDTDSLMVKDVTTNLWKRLTFANLKIWLNSIYALKSMRAYSMRANNTNAAANSTEFDFRIENKKTLTDTGFVYAGTTVPSGTFTGSYSWKLSGNFIFMQINGVWNNNGTGITSITIPFPSDLPLPVKPDGFTSALNRQYQGIGYLAISNTGVANTNPTFIRANSDNTGFEIVITSSALALKSFSCAINYPKS